MNKFWYELMKNYGWGEVKLETILYTLLKQDKDFKEKFLAKCFKSNFNYGSAIVKKEVGRTKKKQGRTDIEVIDDAGNIYVLELKIGFAYPSDEQIAMYESIDRVKEVATLTNVVDCSGSRVHLNTTWEETASLLSDRDEYKAIYEFLNDFGPLKGKGQRAYSVKTQGDTYVFFLSHKPGHYQNGYDGISLYKEFNKYIIPSPTNEMFGKNYKTMDDTIKYIALRYKDETCAKGETILTLSKVVNIENRSAQDINDNVLHKEVVHTDNGDHYVMYLDKVFEKKMPFGYKNGLMKGYIWSGQVINEGNKSFREIFENSKKEQILIEEK